MIKIAKLDIKAVVLEIMIPAPGLFKPIVDELIVEVGPIEISVIIN